MNSFRSRGLLTAFVIVFAALLASFAVSYVNLRRLREHSALVDRTREVFIELHDLQAIVANSVAGMRGFVLTGDEEYVAGNAQAELAVSDSLDRLRRLTADSPVQQAALAQLAAAVERRLSLNQDFIRSARAEGGDAVRDRFLRSEGKTALAPVQECVVQVQREEQRLLIERVARADRAYWTAVVLSFITGSLGLLMAVSGFVLAQRDLARREKEARALESANELLEQRIHERTAAIRQANDALRGEISEREQADRKVRQFAEELQRSNHELEQFAAVASHDLQEPLRKIQAFGDRLRASCHPELNEKGQEYLDRMLAAAGRMRSLIDGLLQYSRVATRTQPAVAVDLGELAREVVGDLEGRIHESHGRVNVNGLPTITADPLLMRQLLQNLIGNALKFQRPGVPPEVRVTGRVVPSPPTAAEETQLGLQCELVVEDNGVGFETAYVDRIFDLFQRLHGRDEYEGTGMGLAICKKIVERHGGKITAASMPGQGSRFLVTLPVVHANLGET
jgi:signal transduction histidine kinase